MKKFLPIFVTALLSFNTIAICAEVEITKAEKDESGVVNFSCNVSDIANLGEQIVTVVAKEYDAANNDVDAIVYINQFNIDAFNDNATEAEAETTDEVDDKTEVGFDYKFGLKDSVDETKVYLLRVGGTDIDDVAQKIIGVSGKTVYVAGDVNSDGYINDVDAALVLKYIGGSYDLDVAGLKAANVVNSDVDDVNMLDVIEILSLSNTTQS
jgi:hypothetical protein